MIKAIIVDDEQPSVAKMEKLLTESGLAEIKATFTRPLAALEYLKSTPIDAAFIDIEMPDLDGIELATRIIDLQKRMAVIFVTAYNQYAVEAFRLNALDYLMKPVTPERLKETLHRIIEEKGILTEPAKLTIQCFGKFKVMSENAEVKFRTEKAEELMAFLIDRRGDFVHRSEICDNLWDEYDGDRALINFNTTLYYVKRALLQQGVTASIEFSRNSYRLDTTGIACDYYQFQIFSSRYGQVNQSNILEAEATAGLYHGDYLAGSEYTWAERNRQMLTDQYLKLLLELAEYYQAMGNNQKAIDWIKKGLIHEPLHKELNYKLIETLVLTNNRISAIRYYEIYRNELKKKMRCEPDSIFSELLK